MWRCGAIGLLWHTICGRIREPANMPSINQELIELSDLQALNALGEVAGKLEEFNLLNVLFRCMILDGETPANSVFSRFDWLCSRSPG